VEHKTHLLSFYAGTRPDGEGRFLREIQYGPDHKLECTHDYIQWLFPLMEKSGFQPDTPILDAKDVREFRSRSELHRNLRSSFMRMLIFYGFELVEDDPLRVVPSESFDERSRNWLTLSNHNHLRITRILKSLRVLGLEEEAAAFFRCLAGLYGKESATNAPRISEETFSYWRSAANSE
jgi:hypothetical protein